MVFVCHDLLCYNLLVPPGFIIIDQIVISCLWLKVTTNQVLKWKQKKTRTKFSVSGEYTLVKS